MSGLRVTLWRETWKFVALPPGDSVHRKLVTALVGEYANEENTGKHGGGRLC